MAKWARILSDPLGIAVAIIYGLPTLDYPFTRDIALFSYVGRIWFGGGLPYRDVYDFTPPGIYALNALALALFGSNMWGIRVFELVGCIVSAVCIGCAVRRAGSRVPGEIGATTILFVGAYYTSRTFLETTQAEFWEGLALLASYAFAARARPIARASFGSGVFLGLAILFKHPAAVIGVATTGTVLWRAGTEVTSMTPRHCGVVRASAFNVAGCLLVLGVVSVYFAVRGGWTAFVDILIRHIWDYQRQYSPRRDAKLGLSSRGPRKRACSCCYRSAPSSFSAGTPSITGGPLRSLRVPLRSVCDRRIREAITYQGPVVRHRARCDARLRARASPVNAIPVYRVELARLSQRKLRPLDVSRAVQPRVSLQLSRGGATWRNASRSRTIG